MNYSLIEIRLLLIVMGLVIIFWRFETNSIRAMVGLCLIAVTSILDWVIKLSETCVSLTMIQIIGLASVGILLAAVGFQCLILRNVK